MRSQLTACFTNLPMTYVDIVYVFSTDSMLYKLAYVDTVFLEVVYVETTESIITNLKHYITVIKFNNGYIIMTQTKQTSIQIMCMSDG